MRNAGRIKPTSMLTGLCLLVKREVFDVIGLFDERFSIGNFEDNDFYLRARLANYELRVAEGAFIHHYGSRTFKSLKVDYAGIMRENQKRFRLKWGLPEPVEAAAPAAIAAAAGGGRVARGPGRAVARTGPRGWKPAGTPSPAAGRRSWTRTSRSRSGSRPPPNCSTSRWRRGVEEAAVELRRTAEGFLQQLPPEEATAA